MGDDRVNPGIPGPPAGKTGGGGFEALFEKFRAGRKGRTQHGTERRNGEMTGFAGRNRRETVVYAEK